MRCLTLANALKKRGAETRFVSRQLPPSLQALVEGAGHGQTLLEQEVRYEPDSGPVLSHSNWLGTSQLSDAQSTRAALDGHSWDWLVVDHYALDSRWERALRGSAEGILAVDDLADRLHDCDVLLDQNFYANKQARYDGLLPGHCVQLLGPRYSLLREEFREQREKVRARSGVVDRVLVCLGGTDADNYTARALSALLSLGRRQLHADVVIGAQHPARADIEAACLAQGFSCHIQSGRMAELMVAADLSIGAGGSTSWERCCLGLPTLALVVAENQRRLVEDTAQAGLLYAPVLGADVTRSLVVHLEALIDNPLLLTMMSRNSMSAVDAHGVDRVLLAMGCGSVAVRDARSDDSDALFSWRNEPQVRCVSRNQDPISREAHRVWFASVLADSSRHLLIGEREGEPVGVVRFDVHDGEAEVSIYMAPGCAGAGVGSELLHEAERLIATRRGDVHSIRAEVLADNAASHRLFQHAGYSMRSAAYAKNVRRRGSPTGKSEGELK